MHDKTISKFNDTMLYKLAQVDGFLSGHYKDNSEFKPNNKK